MAQKKRVWTGVQIGRWTIQSEHAVGPKGMERVDAQCACGTESSVLVASLRRGVSRSCGCLRADLVSVAKRKHGGSQSAEYKVWRDILRRCSDPRRPEYARYGARGIRVCERWIGPDGFANFLADMGPRPMPPDGKRRWWSVERRDNGGPYSPDNCEWATMSAQARNTRRTRFLEWRGRRASLAEWSELTGISHTVIEARLNAGWGTDRALSTPVRKMRKRG